MQIAKQMAGFTPAEADDLRKAIGKKNRELMATLKEQVPRGLRRQQRHADGRERALEADIEPPPTTPSTSPTPPVTR